MRVSVGIVIIGRNEGERLRACLESVRGMGYMAKAQTGTKAAVVYVDSGSTDDSVVLAKSFGAEVLALDLSRPFSAARARNEGFARLREVAPGVEYVQFVDGDCEMAKGWLGAAVELLEENRRYAAVAGRLRERYPEKSIYNRLCDMEWNTPVGDAKACGGIAMYRLAAFEQAGGFNPEVIAGEEPELCVRLRAAGWKIHRLDHEMALHDAAMTRLGQWWRRAVRGGYAYALGAYLHGRPPEWHWVRDVRSTWFWGLILPVLAVVVAWPAWGVSLLLLCGYPVLAGKVYRHMRSRGFSRTDARLYALFCVLAKFPQVQGQARFWVGRLTAKPSAIIEYKKPEVAQA